MNTGALSELGEKLVTRGFAFISRFMPGTSSAAAFSSLAFVDLVEGLNSVQALKPRRSDEAPPNTYSGNFGTGEFPLHTDLAHWAVPPRFVALRCVHGTSRVSTRLLDGRALIASVGVGALRRALVQPRRPLRNGKQLLRLLERDENSNEYMLRWDYLYLRPATRFSERIIAEALQHLSGVKATEVILLDIGDTLILDNWRMLHGRSSTPEHSQRRHVDRSYLKGIR